MWSVAVSREETCVVGTSVLSSTNGTGLGLGNGTGLGPGGMSTITASRLVVGLSWVVALCSVLVSSTTSATTAEGESFSTAVNRRLTVASSPGVLIVTVSTGG